MMLSAEKKPAPRTGPRHSPQRLENGTNPQAGGSHLDYTLSKSPERGQATAAHPPSQALGLHSSSILKVAKFKNAVQVP